MNPKYLVKCTSCSRHTNRAYARAHAGRGKTCTKGTLPLAERHSVSNTREVADDGLRTIRAENVGLKVLVRTTLSRITVNHNPVDSKECLALEVRRENGDITGMFSCEVATD